MNIIIPIGGKGERFINENYKLPKPLIKVFDKTMIEYVIDNLNYNDNDNIFIIYRPQLDNYNFTNIINNKYHNIYLIKLDYDTNGAAETINYGINKIIFSFNDIVTENEPNSIIILNGGLYNEEVLKKLENTSIKIYK
jgi:NDP-sugar pyrophosphorylase family protein